MGQWRPQASNKFPGFGIAGGSGFPTWVLRTERGSSGKAVNVLIHHTIYPDPVP